MFAAGYRQISMSREAKEENQDTNHIEINDSEIKESNSPPIPEQQSQAPGQADEEPEFAETEPEEEELEVRQVEFNGTTYFVDDNTGSVYDPDTSEVVGTCSGDDITLH